MPAPLSENRAFISQYLAIFLAPPSDANSCILQKPNRVPSIQHYSIVNHPTHLIVSSHSYPISCQPLALYRITDSLGPHTGRTATVRVRMAQFTLQHTYVLGKNTFKCITLSTLLRIILRYLNAWTIGMIDMMVRVLLQSALRRHNERPRPAGRRSAQ